METETRTPIRTATAVHVDANRAPLPNLTHSANTDSTWLELGPLTVYVHGTSTERAEYLRRMGQALLAEAGDMRRADVAARTAMSLGRVGV